MKNNNLIQARENKNLTQTQLALMVGKAGKSAVSNWENGHSTPSNEMLLLLASALDTTTDYLLGSSVEGKQSIYGKEVDTDQLTENQRTVLDWAMQQEALSFHSKEELSKILGNLALIMEYEKSKSKSDGNTKS